MKNEAILRKGDELIVLSDGGLLSDAQSKKFINLSVDETVVINPKKNIADIVQFSGDKKDLDTITGVSRALRKPSTIDSGYRAGHKQVDAVAPAFGRRELSAEEVAVTYILPYSTIEDNIEEENLNDTLAKVYATMFGNDIEDLALNGTGSGENPFLSIAKGWIQILKDEADETHIYDTNGSEDYLGTVFPGMLKLLPSKWRNNPNNLVLLVPWSVYETYQTQVGERNTALGDRAITEGVTLRYSGIEVVPVGLMPDGHIILTRRLNPVVGFKRRIRIENEKVPRHLEIETTISARVGFQWKVLDQVVLGYNA
ncbi:hypothetical protein J7M23_09635 [Candidatus Sumerlaeota bacterium]|nr:hypothetical protein [Candidatus Sumerlaeota bacterium]